jgi:cephalosporin hydroxylase
MMSLFKRRKPNELREVRAALSGGEPLDALRKIDIVLARAPNERAAHALRGICLSRLGRHDEALREFETELSANPHDEDAARWRDRLQRKLARQTAQPAPAGDRDWHSALPLEALESIQNGLHNYSYRGVPMLKNPFDVALYPLLLWQLKPRTIFEVGSKSGGSALWFGDLLGNFGIDGHVYSIDIVRVENVSHSRVTFLQGNGRDLGATFRPEQLEGLPRPWLVIEDADHQYQTSIAVLRFFHPWVRPNEYIVVEDGIISDLAGDSTCNSGPHRALKEFLGEHGNEYKIDNYLCDFFGPNFTWATNGYLRKVGPAP